MENTSLRPLCNRRAELPVAEGWARRPCSPEDHLRAHGNMPFGKNHSQARGPMRITRSQSFGRAARLWPLRRTRIRRRRIQKRRRRFLFGKHRAFLRRPAPDCQIAIHRRRMDRHSCIALETRSFVGCAGQNANRYENRCTAAVAVTIRDAVLDSMRAWVIRCGNVFHVESVGIGILPADVDCDGLVLEPFCNIIRHNGIGVRQGNKEVGYARVSWK